MKRCKKCNEVKDLSEFYKAAGMRDGYRSECTACHLAAQKVWYLANREGDRRRQAVAAGEQGTPA